MDKFLPYKNPLAQLIQDRAVELYDRLTALDVSALGMPEHCLYYYNASHSKRLFFSIETSAHLLYRAIKLRDKLVEDVVLMDYGAGVGTLYLLAKMIGCKKVIYNDHLEEWKISAQLIAEAIGIHVDEYIIGDIDATLERLAQLEVQCDVITSRNVVEHIYKLDVFYRAIRERQPGALIYSSTTANYWNPAAVIKHILWHRRWEKDFRKRRLTVIAQRQPNLKDADKVKLSRATRGLATEDLQLAIEAFAKSGTLPGPGIYKSNTCDPENGVWAEHLLSGKEYRKLIDQKLFHVSFASGFWDTHYRNEWMNFIGRKLNKLISRGGRRGMRIAPFIYVIASPR